MGTQAEPKRDGSRGKVRQKTEDRVIFKAIGKFTAKESVNL